MVLESKFSLLEEDLRISEREKFLFPQKRERKKCSSKNKMQQTSNKNNRKKSI